MHVHPAVPGDREQPGIRSVGDPVLRPVSQRGQHGILHQILRGGEIAGHIDQRRDQSARVVSHHAGQPIVNFIGHMDSNAIGRTSTTGQPGQVFAACNTSSR